MSLQCQDIVNGALRLIGVLAAGEAASPEEMTDGIISLNEMLDGWNIDRLDVFQIVNTVYNLINGTSTYTLGVGGTLNSVRPVSIKNAAAVTSAGLSLPMEILGSEEWAAVIEKTVSGTVPRKLYCDFAFPLANLSIWPTPSGSPQLSLYYWGQFTTFVNATDVFTFPPGYEIAIRYNLALVMAPEYGRQASPELAGKAQDSLMKLQMLNRPPVSGVADEQIERARVTQQVMGPGGSLNPPQPTVPGPRE